MTIETWPIDKPIPYARNARKLSDRAVDTVAASLKEFGWQQSCVADDNDAFTVHNEFSRTFPSLPAMTAFSVPVPR